MSNMQITHKKALTLFYIKVQVGTLANIFACQPHALNTLILSMFLLYYLLSFSY